MKNYYDILQIKRNSSESDIRDAYRKLAKKHHPDVNKSSGATEKFIEATEAYEFLMAHVHDHKTRVEDHDYEDYRKTQEYEEFIRKVRENARRQSKMRYEEFRKQNEAFQKSGLNDMVLILTMAGRIFLTSLFFFLIIYPVYMAFHKDIRAMFFLIPTLPFATIIAWYTYNNRRKYFLPGSFYYTPKRIIHLFTDKIPTTDKCYYCRNLPAGSRPYQLELLRLKDLKLQTEGFRQHKASYINDKAVIIVPRSKKAMLVHSVNSLIKIFTVLAFLIFMTNLSTIWKIIAGMISGGLISYLLLLMTGTKDNVSYLYSIGSILRIIFWLTIVGLVSDYSIKPMGLSASDEIYFVIAVILLTDCFLMGFLKMILGKRSYIPITKQYPEITQKFEEGYKLYNDIPVISVVYPTFKWIFG